MKSKKNQNRTTRTMRISVSQHPSITAPCRCWGRCGGGSASVAAAQDHLLGWRGPSSCPCAAFGLRRDVEVAKEPPVTVASHFSSSLPSPPPTAAAAVVVAAAAAAPLPPLALWTRSRSP